MKSPSNNPQGRRDALRAWFVAGRRDFSWRRTRDPWRTLVAETLLRRTRAAQVEQRIDHVLATFPTAAAMAQAPLAQVRDELRPFGLQWRADNLAATSKVIEDRLGGRIPTTIEELMLLPGVGPYVAAATSAAISDARVTLVDTNTVRVAARVAGIHRLGDIRRNSDVHKAIAALLGGRAPANDWWAVLDLAASICVPRKPRCEGCPIQAHCITGQATSGENGGGTA